LKISEKEKKYFDNLKIGVLVKTLVKLILENDSITDLEIENLQKKDYSKNNFNVIFPILKKVDINKLIKEDRLINGNPRYYANPIENKKKHYLLTNEWKEFHREDFMIWLKRKVKE
jgi:hypothetical protein